MDLLLTFTVAILIQAVFFIFAAAFKTDKVTDLSYGLTFIILAGYLLFTNPVTGYSALLVGMVVLWGLRLATYLLMRIIKMKRDKRFDSIREHFWSFAKFWIGQGIAVWIIMLPVIMGFSGALSAISWIGAGIWLLGFVIETVADWQKYEFKNKYPHTWVQSGLWRYARHPNYFGEMLIWWGVFIAVLPSLSGWSYVAVVGPVSITFILLFVTGIPPLERHMRDTYGNKPGFDEYVKNTRLLVPLK